MMYNLLIVDDEKIEREALRFFLSKHQLPLASVYEAGNASQALSICHQRHIDIITLDINLPGMNGLDFLDTIRSEGNTAKVLISTAYSQFEYAVKALQNGALDFLVKPLSEEQLVASLEKTIDRLDKEASARSELKRMGDYLKVREERLQAVRQGAEEENPVAQIKNYIAQHYSERIGLDEIALDLAYSKFTIAKIFKAQTGDTVVSFLIRYRMEKAKELLELTTEPVKLVAFRVGYSDPNYFMWTFKKQVGLSPLQYRAKKLKERRLTSE